MKILLTIFIILPLLARAGTFAETEKLFQQGKYDECEKSIAKLQTSGKLTKQQQGKLNAMSEYILGATPEKIAKTVKKAKETAAHKGWLTKDLLKHSSTLIRRAEDWKMRGIPEYQELSDTAATLLKQAKDGGNPETAIKRLMLSVKNHNLNGEYRMPIEQIKRLLRLYYPVRRYQRSKRPAGAVQLLILLGEQHSNLGINSSSPRDKQSAFAAAAEYYLKAVDSVSTRSSQFQDLCNRLHYCKTTLRLLGYRLNLPSKIKPRQSASIEMVDAMFRERRYHDAAMALEKSKHPSLKLRYAVALSAIGKTDEAVKAVNSIDAKISEPHLLLNAARFTMSTKKYDDAAVLLKMYLQHSPKGTDALNARKTYANILLDQQKYIKAANEFTLLAQEDKKEQDKMLFNAAQCLYQAKDYQQCIEKLQAVAALPEYQILKIQAYIQLKDFTVALKTCQQTLQAKELSAEHRQQTLKLAISCAEKVNIDMAIKLSNTFLQNYPQESEAMDYAKRLLRLYEKQKAPAVAYLELGNWSIKHHLQSSETVPLILSCIEHIKATKDKEKLYNALLKRNNFKSGELSILLDRLPSLQLKQKFANRYQKPFENTPGLCKLYLQIAKIEMELKNYNSTLSHCEKILSQKEVFEYKNTKQLQAQALMNLERFKDARQAYQELLLTKLAADEKSQIVFALAQSWERDGDAKKAIATSWTAIPLSGNVPTKEKPQIKQLLQLIIRNAEKINSKEDVKDAQELLKSLTRQ